MALLLNSGRVLFASAPRAAGSVTSGLAGSAPALQRRALLSLARTDLGCSCSRPASGTALLATTAMAATATAESPYDFTVTDIDGKKVDLSRYKGKVILVVNVASQCGFTPQYKELGELYDRYSSQGFVVLGFPCNQFGGQEPADNSKIKQFAEARGAKFPMMAKVDVNGSRAEPFYSYLKSKKGGLLVPDVKWNFTKFLIDRNGNVSKRYGSATTPKSIEGDIKALL